MILEFANIFCLVSRVKNQKTVLEVVSKSITKNQCLFFFFFQNSNIINNFFFLKFLLKIICFQINFYYAQHILLIWELFSNLNNG